MTKDDAVQAGAHILSISGDAEAAHSREDELYERFVRHVAEHGPADLAEVAQVLLSTKEMDFERWCA